MSFEVKTSKTFCFAWFLLIINIIIALIWYAVLLYDRFVSWFISFEVIFWIYFVFDFCLSAELLFFLWRRNSNKYFSLIWFNWRFLKSDAWQICRFENVRVEWKKNEFESLFWKTIFKTFIDKKIEIDRKFSHFVNRINNLKNVIFANCFFFRISISFVLSFFEFSDFLWRQFLIDFWLNYFLTLSHCFRNDQIFSDFSSIYFKKEFEKLLSKKNFRTRRNEIKNDLKKIQKRLITIKWKNNK